MAITLLPNDMISDTYEFEHEGTVFRDALVMPRSEYEAMTQEQIDAMKQSRFDNWVSIAFSPAPPEV